MPSCAKPSRALIVVKCREGVSKRFGLCPWTIRDTTCAVSRGLVENRLHSSNLSNLGSQNKTLYTFKKTCSFFTTSVWSSLEFCTHHILFVQSRNIKYACTVSPYTLISILWILVATRRRWPTAPPSSGSWAKPHWSTSGLQNLEAAHQCFIDFGVDESYGN